METKELKEKLNKLTRELAENDIACLQVCIVHNKNSTTLVTDGTLDTYSRIGICEYLLKRDNYILEQQIAKEFFDNNNK